MTLLNQVLRWMRHADSPEVAESRIHTTNLNERTALTRTLIDEPHKLSRRDIATLITVRSDPLHSYIHGLGKNND
jgi:hypothetical protein